MDAGKLSYCSCPAERRKENGVDNESRCHMAYHFSRAGRDRDIYAGPDDDLVCRRRSGGDHCGGAGWSHLAAGFSCDHRIGGAVILYKAGSGEIF